MLYIEYLSETIYNWVESQGWHNKTILECLALIASEVGEAINECRGSKPTLEFGSELADIILRTLDLAKICNIDIETELRNKIISNIKNGRGKNKLK